VFLFQDTLGPDGLDSPQDALIVLTGVSGSLDAHHT
jgi:hypothetical protein